MQAAAVVVSVTLTLVAIALAARAVSEIVRVIRLGEPVHDRTDRLGWRLTTMLRETLGHTRMLKWSAVGAAHWFVFVGFGLLFFTLVTAYGQLFDAEFALPLIGQWYPFEWVAEFITWAMLVGIALLIAIRLRSHPARTGRPSRFTGSTMWQGYYVEATVVGVGLCILVLRGAEYALGAGSQAHFPLTFFIGDAMRGLSTGALESTVFVVAAVKIVISMAWLIVIATHVTMGVAWHRFTAFVNILFKREADGGTALGAAKPLTIKGEPVDFEQLDDLDEDAALGVGKVEDFSWRHCWTSRRAPSAGGASRNARRGTPPSRCRRSCWSWTCATTRTPRPRTSLPVAARTWPATNARRQSSSPTCRPRRWQRPSGRSWARPMPKG